MGEAHAGGLGEDRSSDPRVGYDDTAISRRPKPLPATDNPAGHQKPTASPTRRRLSRLRGDNQAGHQGHQEAHAVGLDTGQFLVPARSKRRPPGCAVRDIARHLRQAVIYRALKVRQWKYTPTLVGETPVPVYMTLAVHLDVR